MTPAWKIKAARATAFVFEQLGKPCSGRLSVESAIVGGGALNPRRPTSSCSVRAVAAAFTWRFVSKTDARIAVQSETASDSTMFGERAVFFAQRRGVLPERFGMHLLPTHVIGFNPDSTSGA